MSPSARFVIRRMAHLTKPSQSATKRCGERFGARRSTWLFANVFVTRVGEQFARARARFAKVQRSRCSPAVSAHACFQPSFATRPGGVETQWVGYVKPSSMKRLGTRERSSDGRCDRHSCVISKIKLDARSPS